MENQYLLLVSVLLGMTVGAVVYGVAAKIVSIWSGEPEAAGCPQGFTAVPDSAADRKTD